MQQANDFLAESEALEQLIAPLQASDFAHPTGFKSWTFESIMRHLHFLEPYGEPCAHGAR